LAGFYLGDGQAFVDDPHLLGRARQPIGLGGDGRFGRRQLGAERILASGGGGAGRRHFLAFVLGSASVFQQGGQLARPLFSSPLDVFAAAPQFGQRLGPLLSRRLGGLQGVAADDDAGRREVDFFFGGDDLGFQRLTVAVQLLQFAPSRNQAQ